MNGQDHREIAEQLKRTAKAYPWEPYKELGPPPRRHFRSLDDGLSVCFTLDVVPGGLFWHLSLCRVPQGVSRAEQELWCRLFFEEQPMIERPSEIPGLGSRHFYWKAERKEA